jgi:hypothetical protein
MHDRRSGRSGRSSTSPQAKGWRYMRSPLGGEDWRL